MGTEVCGHHTIYLYYVNSIHFTCLKYSTKLFFMWVPILKGFSFHMLHSQYKIFNRFYVNTQKWDPIVYFGFRKLFLHLTIFPGHPFHMNKYMSPTSFIRPWMCADTLFFWISWFLSMQAQKLWATMQWKEFGAYKAGR